MYNVFFLNSSVMKTMIIYLTDRSSIIFVGVFNIERIKLLKIVVKFYCRYVRVIEIC